VIALLEVRRSGRALPVAVLATALFSIYGIAAFFLYFMPAAILAGSEPQPTP
jgi:hypothetical protein